VKVGADTVPAGVPAVLASDSATAELVVLAVGAALIDSLARLVPLPNTDWGIMDRAPVPPDAFLNGSSWKCVARADPVNVGALFVPAGVPADTADVFWLAVPVKVGAATVPVGVPALTALVLCDDVPVNVGAATLPAGVPALTALVFWLLVPVNVGAATEPVGVPVFAPPVAPGVPKSGSPARYPARNLP